VWNDPEIDWSSFDVALIRSAWDYHLRNDEFFTWVDRVRHQTHVVNDPDLMRWNSDKHYLVELRDAGVPIVPTMFLERGERRDVREILDRLETREFVIKPTVSANSYGLTIVAEGHEPLERAQSGLDVALAVGDVMVQPFLREVYDLAERSLVYFNGAFSHAVLRQVAKVDDLSLRPRTTPSREEMELAERALSLLPRVPLYARIDVIPRYSGEIVLSELELIEPSLFLMSDPGSVARFADEIKGYLCGSS
jgi:glutathione synthase/RimK-type ligase-like ATP-grasp enzyme